MRLVPIAVYCALLLTGCENIPNFTSVKPVVYKDETGKKHTRGNKSPYVVFGKSYSVLPDSMGFREIGIASWYGKKFHGRQTSNGETYDMFKFTAAHRSLPLPTIVRVTNLDNGYSAILRVNDRGPFHDDRVIDLSYKAAVQLGFSKKGTATVVIEALDEVNYPGRKRITPDDKHSYLQMGAFSQLKGAEELQQKIKKLIEINGIHTIGVKILLTETSLSSVLHKVWLGPIWEEETLEHIVRIVRGANLGTPFKVAMD